MTACSWFFWRLVAPLKPATLILYAGDNDLGDGESPEHILGQLQHLLRQLDACSPECRLGLLTVKLSPARESLVERIRAVNIGLAAVAEARVRTVVVDVHSAMLNADGRPQPEHYQPDGLHLSPAGYRVWREEVLRHRAELF